MAFRPRLAAGLALSGQEIGDDGPGGQVGLAPGGEGFLQGDTAGTACMGGNNYFEGWPSQQRYWLELPWCGKISVL